MPQVELFGVLRNKAGMGVVCVDATTVHEALVEVERKCPLLSGLLLDGMQLSRAFRLSINGERFLRELSTPLDAGDSLLVIAADAGG